MRFLVLAALLSFSAQAQSSAQIAPQRVAWATKQVRDQVGGDLKPCPESFLSIGTPYKQCLIRGGDLAKVRRDFAPLQKYLHGPWKTTAQGSSYNWLRVSGGLVYVRIQRNPGKGAPNLIYLDIPTKR